MVSKGLMGPTRVAIPSEDVYPRGTGSILPGLREREPFFANCLAFGLSAAYPPEVRLLYPNSRKMGSFQIHSFGSIGLDWLTAASPKRW
jgi:hypothetical protein